MGGVQGWCLRLQYGLMLDHWLVGCLRLQCSMMPGVWVAGVGCLHLQDGLMLGNEVVGCLHLECGLMPDFWVEVFVELQGVLAALTSINRCFPCTRQTVLVENQPSAFTGCIVCKQCLLNMILWTLIQESQTKVLVILQLMIDIFYNN